MYIVDASLGVAIYVHLAACIAIWVGLDPAKSNRYEDPMAYMCAVSCVAADYDSLLDPFKLG
jgi:hypothetical protein